MQISKGILKAEQYAEDLSNMKTAWRRLPVLSNLLYLLCRNDFMMNNVNTKPGKRIQVDYEKCSGCGQCAELCPVDNIEFNAAPKWSDGCETCMRCISFCPSNAIHFAGKEFTKKYRAVKAGELFPRRKQT